MQYSAIQWSEFNKLEHSKLSRPNKLAHGKVRHHAHYWNASGMMMSFTPWRLWIGTSTSGQWPTAVVTRPALTRVPSGYLSQLCYTANSTARFSVKTVKVLWIAWAQYELQFCRARFFNLNNTIHCAQRSGCGNDVTGWHHLAEPVSKLLLSYANGDLVKVTVKLHFALDFNNFVSFITIVLSFFIFHFFFLSWHSFSSVAYKSWNRIFRMFGGKDKVSTTQEPTRRPLHVR